VLNDPDAQHGLPILFALGFLTVLIYISRRVVVAIASASDATIACVTGYLRPRPDPQLEVALRSAFADFDRELAVLLRHQPAGG
jgi:hypothetical protein